LRPRYLEEHAALKECGGEMHPMVQYMSAAWETAWCGKIALLEGDLKSFDRLMNDNHRLVDIMMLYCGFSDGAGWANNLFIETALDHGALGAELAHRRRLGLCIERTGAGRKSCTNVVGDCRLE
jgi:hypothetical protein